MPRTTQKARRGPGRPSQPIAREELLDIARKAFADHGYAGTSMQKIASEAGLTKASLFHHFPGKEQLYLESLATVLSDLQALVEEARVAEGDFLGRLSRLGQMTVEYLGGRPETARLITRELLGSGPFISGGGAEMVQSILMRLAAFLEGGMDSGAIERRDPRHLALSIIGMHLYMFSAPGAASRFLEKSVFDRSTVEERKASAADHVEALVTGKSS